MARLIERTFDPARPVTVRRFFVAAGRHWQPGDTFDWPRLAIAQRRVKQLFDNGKLMHETYATAVPAPVAPPPPPTTPEPSIEQEIEDEDSHDNAAASQEPATEPATEPQDDLDGLNMVQLREIALAEDAPSRVSREAQREAIREARRARSGE
jgi:hypothetical protein